MSHNPLTLAPYTPPEPITTLPSPSYVVPFFCSTRNQWLDVKASRTDPLLAIGGVVFTLPRGRLRPSTETNMFIYPLEQASDDIPPGWEHNPRSFYANIGLPQQRTTAAIAGLKLLQFLNDLRRDAMSPPDPIVLVADGLEEHQPHFLMLIEKMTEAIAQRTGPFTRFQSRDVNELAETLARISFADVVPTLAHMAGVRKREARVIFDRYKGAFIDTAQEDALQVGYGLMRALESYKALPPLEG